jgi:peptidoglycan/xylan/chitin deacetylase (PgdA/CDA1 family)
MYGLMFHHFYDDAQYPASPLVQHPPIKHPKSQGAISGGEFEQLLHRLTREGAHLLDAPVWLDKALKGQLQPNEHCLTFDDALACQFDIALPVMQQFGLRAFWFVYSHVLAGKPEWLELYRDFRMRAFATVNDFYAAFEAQQPPPIQQLMTTAAPLLNSYLTDYPFYTPEDRRFRFLRDEVLGPEAYHTAMQQLMAQYGWSTTDAIQRLWLTEHQVLSLHQQGHIIGLHSSSHPTQLAAMAVEEQQQEYTDNHTHLTQLLGQAPTTMAHPCNSYSPDTLNILDALGITLGFCATRQPPDTCQPLSGGAASDTPFTHLLWPREDVANLINRPYTETRF